MTLVVSDASPLIALSQIDQLKLLHALFGEVVIPEAVEGEVKRGGLVLPAFIITRPLAMRVGLDLLRHKLDDGETEAIILAQQDGADWLLVDELPARKIAQALGLRVAGTLGLLVRAKEKGLLAAVRPHVEALLQHGFRAAPALVEQVLRQAGEANA